MGSAEPTVKVTLKGAPDGMPETVLVRRGDLVSNRLKIPYRAGYEHFVPEPRPQSVPEDGAVFVWCDRTKVAE
ncbi:MAG TPA: DUF5988 family protein [Amycolatopsis sp.]|uniref:DUF5988 family protein n=1 Tax=Amycolatopsis nalaikhensis TaxID=715472 RepID=A0ABY8XGF7_9PSEU|nr:DUF5988 family protein [Amycolatopsis sp. 2-2]WIV54701.1 DUF5988 family protein [Amycolatopsis sp. 2-2]